MTFAQPFCTSVRAGDEPAETCLRITKFFAESVRPGRLWLAIDPASGRPHIVDCCGSREHQAIQLDGLRDRLAFEGFEVLATTVSASDSGSATAIAIGADLSDVDELMKAVRRCVRVEVRRAF